MLPIFSKMAMLLFLLCSVQAFGQEMDLDLPDPLSNHGKAVDTKQDWQKHRRPAILESFQTQVYGQVPQKDVSVSFIVDQENPQALCSQAHSKSVTVLFSNSQDTVSMHLMLYLPKANQPVPVFVGLNFYGNHTVHFDADIPISKSWAPNNPQFCIFDNQLDHLSRGVRAHRWPIERIIERGYGLAAIYSGDLDPDYDDGFQNGIHPLFYDRDQNQPKADEWGTIGAWAWGLSRALDYFEQDAAVDEKRVAVIGHSRMGKAALWAGAQDERFALVVSNDSGCGGAAISRRKSGETVKAINTQFPHWFCKNFHQNNEKEEKLPVDQHLLISLIAPRPVYVASAEQDSWADPVGEYLSLYYAAPVFHLFGHSTNLPKDQPKVNEPLQQGPLGYHVRTGAHDITRYDWERYLDFADQHLKK